MKLLTDCNLSTVPDAANLALEEPVTLEEIYQAIKTGNPHKAPGIDGIRLEFLKKTWEATKEDLLQIVNEMYIEENISDYQKFGIIVSIPKQPHATQVEHYRHLTILNTDFKLVTRIIANRLRPWMQDLLHSSQHCGLMGNSVFEAITTIRDAVAHAEVTRSPLCVLTIDFQGAFDNVSHEYLFEVLCKYGFSEHFRKRIWNIYKNSISSVQIHGYRSCPFPIKSSLRQGCLLSMILYAMCFNPLLCTLENPLRCLRMGRHCARTSAVAYADDVTIFVTTPTDITKLQEAIHCFEAASGARVNIQKSRAIACGSWDKSIEIMNIPYHDTATVLGFQIKNTVGESALASWTKTTAKIRAQAQEAYCRMLTLDKIIQFVHEYLMVCAWYVSQIYPPPRLTYVCVN